MTWAIADIVRNSIMDALSAAVDAGGVAGYLRIYDSTQPAKGGTATVLLAEIPLNYPSFAASSGGILTLDITPEPQDSSANASGDAIWCRWVDSAGTFVMDGTVGTSGADLNINTITISAGIIVKVTSCVLTGPNA